jgi:outer membrane protein assembly factor BamB
MLVSASNALQGLDPASGEVQWWAKTPGDVCSPVVSGSVVYTDSGRGGPGVLVDAGGSGDVTATNIKWTINQIPEGLSSPAIVGDFLYRTHNPGILKCVDMASGKDLYAKRLEGLSAASSPLVTPDGLVYFASAGKSYVLKAGPTFDVVATNDLNDPGPASPAVAGERLILKGRDFLFCIGKKP